MYFVEQHIISRNHKSWKSIDYNCFLSKNLYNHTLYKIKEHYEQTGKFLRAYDIIKQFTNENQVDYRALPAAVAQQIIMVIDQNHRSFFKSIKRFGKNKDGYKTPPRPPKFKHKIKGRNILILTNQSSKINKKDGLIHFPKQMNLPHLKTKVSSFKQIRIIPKTSCYVVEVICEKEINDLRLNKNNVIAIDLGVNNLCALTTNQPDIKSFLINGRPIKSMNQYYNKKKAKLLSQLNKQNSRRRTSRKIQALTLKHNNKIKNYFHHTSKYIIEFCKQNNIGTLIIGKNDGWKDNVNIGKRNNQNFVMIPYNMLIQQLKYKGELVGIDVVEVNESYTSKCSALDLEPVCKHDEYTGKRVKRGLFRMGTGISLNADINGSLNIMRKVIGDGFMATSNRGYVVYPLLIEPI